MQDCSWIAQVEYQGQSGQTLYTGMSCLSWQWHRTGSRWSSVRTLLVAPLWCDLGFFPNSRGNKAAANLRPTGILVHTPFIDRCYQIGHRLDLKYLL